MVGRFEIVVQGNHPSFAGHTPAPEQLRRGLVIEGHARLETGVQDHPGRAQSKEQRALLYPGPIILIEGVVLSEGRGRQRTHGVLIAGLPLPAPLVPSPPEVLLFVVPED